MKRNVNRSGSPGARLKEWELRAVAEIGPQTFVALMHAAKARDEGGLPPWAAAEYGIDRAQAWADRVFGGERKPPMDADERRLERTEQRSG